MNSHTFFVQISITSCRSLGWENTFVRVLSFKWGSSFITISSTQCCQIVGKSFRFSCRKSDLNICIQVVSKVEMYLLIYSHYINKNIPKINIKTILQLLLIILYAKRQLQRHEISISHYHHITLTKFMYKWIFR